MRKKEPKVDCSLGWLEVEGLQARGRRKGEAS